MTRPTRASLVPRCPPDRPDPRRVRRREHDRHRRRLAHGGTPADPDPGRCDGNAVPSLPAVAIPSFDLGALTGGIPGVDSYRTSPARTASSSTRTVVVTKPELSQGHHDLQRGRHRRFAVIVIGDEAWAGAGSGRRLHVGPGAAGERRCSLAFDPTLMLGGLRDLNGARRPPTRHRGQERRAGASLPDRSDDDRRDRLLRMPAGAAIDVWVAEAGYLVSWEMSGFKEARTWRSRSPTSTTRPTRSNARTDAPALDLDLGPGFGRAQLFAQPQAQPDGTDRRARPSTR